MRFQHNNLYFYKVTTVSLINEWGLHVPPVESIHCPRYGPSPVDELYCRLDEPSEIKGTPPAFQIYICRWKALKRTLEILGRRQPEKQGDFVITESQNQAAQREKSWDFL